MTKVLNSIDYNDYAFSSFEDIIKRTPDGIEVVRDVPHCRQLLSYKEAVITNDRIILRKARPSKDPNTVPRPVAPASESNLRKGTYTGLMTASTGARFKKSFDALMFNSRPFKTIDPDTNKPRIARMVAWTLTLPDTVIIDGKTMWRLFELLRKRLERKGLSFHYIAKMEHQANGQPHIHFNVTQYLKYDTIYNAWNSVLDSRDLLTGWRLSNPSKQPQGAKFLYLWTDSHCNSYLWSYLKKNTQNQLPLNGRVWSCSRSIAKPQPRRIVFNKDQIIRLRGAVSTGRATYHEKTVLTPVKYFDKTIRSYHCRRDRLYEQWRFPNHEALLQCLSMTNLSIVSSHKKAFRDNEQPPYDKHLIFDKHFSKYRTMKYFTINVSNSLKFNKPTPGEDLYTMLCIQAYALRIKSDPHDLFSFSRKFHANFFIKDHSDPLSELRSRYLSSLARPVPLLPTQPSLF